MEIISQSLKNICSQLIIIQESSKLMNTGTQPPQLKLIKFLHLIMIFLCLLASFALYTAPSLSVKLLISLLLLAYTFMLVTNSAPIRALFKLTNDQNEQNYLYLRNWQSSIAPNNIQAEQKDSRTLNSAAGLVQKRYANESINNISKDRSFEKSLDIKNMSMSIYRSLSTSGLSETRLSRIRGKGTRQLKGTDLSEAFPQNQKSENNSSFLKSQGSGIMLIDTQTCLNNNTQQFKQFYEKQYEKMLKNVMKKDRKYIAKRYELLLSHIQKSVKSIVNEHIFLKDKIKGLSQQFFEITIVDSDKQLASQISSSSSQSHAQLKISYYLFIYKLLLLYEQKISFAEVGLKMRKEKRWSNLQSRILQLTRIMFKLSQTLGVDHSLVKSKFKDNTKNYLQDYRNAIGMLQTYIQIDLADKDKDNESKDSSKLSYQAKCRAYVLYIMVREINANLKYTAKVRFNDHFNFLYPKQNKIQFQISRKAGSEGPLPHFDLRALDEEKETLRICCEPGQRNYLSVLYSLLYEFSKKEELLSWNGYIKGLVSDVV